MLTKKQNFLETIKGGNPDRYVNCFEPFDFPFFCDPLNLRGEPMVPGGTWHNLWGVKMSFPEWAPGPMPVHDEESIVLHDIEDWKKVFNAPDLNFTEEEWAPMDEAVSKIDRNEVFMTLAFFPGLLEQTHYLMGMEGAMMAILTDPDLVREMVESYVDWEIEYAAQMIKRYKPEAMFHHDDWGSHTSTLISPASFDEVYLEPYKRLYGFYKDNGCDVIVHHSDSYAATLVPQMIEIGIDVFQGCVSTNNIPELIAQYGPQITFMGGIDNGRVDRVDWTPESVEAEVRKVCLECGTKYFIPCLTAGGPGSTYPGVYEAANVAIDQMSKEMFA